MIDQPLDTNTIYEFSMNQFRVIGMSSQSSGSAASFNLNGTAAEVGFRIELPYGCTIDGLAMQLTGFAGVSASAAIDVYLVPGLSASSTRAGPTSAAFASITGLTVGVTGWYQAEFPTPYFAGTGAGLWVRVINSSAAPGTNYPQIRVHGGRQAKLNGLCTSPFRCHTTANAWSSAGSAQNGPSAVLIVTQEGSRRTFGEPFWGTTLTGFSGASGERGMLFGPGNAANEVSLLIWDAGVNAQGCRLHAASEAPNGSSLLAYEKGDSSMLTTTPTGTAVMNLGMLHLPGQRVVLEPEEQYRAVLWYTSTTIQRPQMEIIMMNGNTSGMSLGNLLEEIVNEGSVGWATQETSGGTWIDYSPLRTPYVYAGVPHMFLGLNRLPQPQSGAV